MDQIPNKWSPDVHKPEPFLNDMSKRGAFPTLPSTNSEPLFFYDLPPFSLGRTLTWWGLDGAPPWSGKPDSPSRWWGSWCFPAGGAYSGAYDIEHAQGHRVRCNVYSGGTMVGYEIYTINTRVNKVQSTPGHDIWPWKHKRWIPCVYCMYDVLRILYNAQWDVKIFICSVKTLIKVIETYTEQSLTKIVQLSVERTKASVYVDVAILQASLTWAAGG